MAWLATGWELYPWEVRSMPGRDFAAQQHLFMCHIFQACGTAVQSPESGRGWERRGCTEPGLCNKGILLEPAGWPVLPGAGPRFIPCPLSLPPGGLVHGVLLCS